MLLTPPCAACGGRTGPVCRRCSAELVPAGPAPPPLGLDGWWALVPYDDVARVLLTTGKNGQRRDVLAWWASALVARVPRPEEGTVLTWAPTGADRRRRRGFDQAELLARALARRWSLPCRATLRRRPGPAQAGRSRLERRAHPGFRAVRAAPRRVLVVDDVATSGGTLTAAARALRDAGALEVRAVVLARADRPR